MRPAAGLRPSLFNRQLRFAATGLWLVVCAACCGVATGLAAPISIEERESLALPTAERLAAIHQRAQLEGWAAQTPALRAAALHAYRRGKLPVAAAWMNVCRWSGLLGQTEAQFIPAWIKAVQNHGVAHANMPTQYRTLPASLRERLSPDCQAWVIGHAEFSEEFFATVQPVDYLPRVFEILSDLYRHDPARFARYAHLALAIAVVYDVPPPPDWPHAQVPAEVLRRAWPRPLDAFTWWTNQDLTGRTLHPLAELGADELKFVVDTAAPLDELLWSEQVADYPLTQLERAYTMVSYRSDRASNQLGLWPEKTYDLPSILGAGGICVDQAYFAAHVGKARGVPTLLFQGPGTNGRHAWFGFLDRGRQWKLDAGRYAAQRFVTGVARDPQTWRPISDHELKFLSERFQAAPAFRQSQIHARFAADYLLGGDAASAVLAARKAVQLESRNQPGWQILLAAEKSAGRTPRELEATLGEAVRAFRRYPDLEAFYSGQLVTSLRTRGEGAAADTEQSRIARKYRGERADLTVQQARDALLRSLATEPLEGQIRAYEAAVDKFGAGAGIAFFDQIVEVFAEHLAQLQQGDEARRAVHRARFALKPEPNSQLAQEFDALAQRLRNVK